MFCLLFFAVNLQSQNAIIDSLKNELSIYPEKDTTRVNLLNAIASKSYGLDQDQLKKYADEANTLAEEINFFKGEARSWYLKGLYDLVKGDLENATTCIDQSLSLEKKVDNTIGISTCYDLIGTISRFQEDYDKSLLYYDKALQIARDLGKKFEAAGTLTNIGAVLNTLGEFDEAEAVLKESIAIYDSLDSRTRILQPMSNLALVYNQQGRNVEALGYYQKCLTGYREQGNKVFGAAVLLNMSLVYSTIDENDKALPYLEEALELNKELGRELEISKCIIGLGYIHRFKKEYNKALEYYDEGLEICEKIDSKEGLYNCYSNISTLYIEKEEYDLALKSLKKGLEVSLDMGGKRGIAESYFQLGLIYYNLGDNKKAFENALKGKEIADELSLIGTQKESNLILSKIYEKENNHKKALGRYKEYKMLSDSILSKESIQKIAELEYDYKYKKELDAASNRELKLTETVETTSQNLAKSQRNLLLGVIGFLLMSLVLGAIIFFLKLRNAKSKTQNIAIEQKLLRSQMTPHFIFNSLSVLQGMILNKEDKKSISYLSRFSKLLRITLENSRDKMVLLAKELTAIENYLALHNLENESYEYSVSVDDTIDQSLFKIPPMLIQPFVENAIEHAFVDQKVNKKIDVYLKSINEELICTIADNGIGVEVQEGNKRKEKKSLATTITSERLKILSKDFKMKGSFTIEDRKKYNEQGTIVTLIIPYQKLVK